jgi:DNA-binding LacI/PurR family transcriptional regulator
MNQYASLIPKRKKPVIGFQLIHMFIDYCVSFIPGMRQACIDNNADLMIISGGDLLPPTGHYVHLQNTIYQYANPNNIDAFVILGASMSGYVTPEIFNDFISRLSPMPIVSISKVIPGAASLIIDNKSGLRKAITHLIKDHGYKKIAFMSGAENNVEAATRFSVYCEVLQAHGMPLDQNLITPPGSTGHTKARKDIALLFDERKVRPDAIVAVSYPTISALSVSTTA